MDQDVEANSVPGCPSSSADVGFSFSRGDQSVTPLTGSTDFVAKRRWPRFFVNMAVQVRVTTQGPTRIVTWEGQGSDISCGGLAVSVDTHLPIGSQVGVEFTLPNSDQAMTLRCFVRNRQGNRHGVEFITENDQDYRAAGQLQAILATMNPHLAS